VVVDPSGDRKERSVSDEEVEAVTIAQAEMAISRATSSARRHPAFFLAMSSLLIVLVFLGFAPTYYLRPIAAGPIPGYLHVHGAAMTTWFLLLLVQTALIATRRRALHRRLGIAGACVAVVIVVLNPLVVAWSVPHLMAGNGSTELTAFIVVVDLLLVGIFAALVGLAIRWRRYPETHSRMLVLASLAVLGPALGRLSLNLAGTPLPGVIALMTLPLLVVVHDGVMMKWVHPVSGWGATAIVGSTLISIAIANTAAGAAIVRWFL
jgi:hypothetical protein